MLSLNLAIADDHPMMRNAVKNILLESELPINQLFESANGQELYIKVQGQPALDLAVLDINMPGLNGVETALKLKEKFPNIKLLALTMLQDEEQLLAIFKAGFNGYLSKEKSATLLLKAIETIMAGYTFFPDKVNALVQAEQNAQKDLNVRELQFLRYSCTDDTYAQIADKMNLSPKTIDGYRAKLFERFNVKSRTGLAIYALSEGLIDLNEL